MPLPKIPPDLPYAAWNDGVDYYFGKVATKIVSRGDGGDYYADGVADDVEINAAIQALPANGGIVYLKGKGNPFNTTNPIVNTGKSYVWLIGEGSGNPYLQGRTYKGSTVIVPHFDDYAIKWDAVVDTNYPCSGGFKGLQIDITDSNYASGGIRLGSNGVGVGGYPFTIDDTHVWMDENVLTSRRLLSVENRMLWLQVLGSTFWRHSDGDAIVFAPGSYWNNECYFRGVIARGWGAGYAALLLAGGVQVCLEFVSCQFFSDSGGSGGGDGVRISNSPSGSFMGPITFKNTFFEICGVGVRVLTNPGNPINFIGCDWEALYQSMVGVSGQIVNYMGNREYGVTITLPFDERGNGSYTY